MFDTASIIINIGILGYLIFSIFTGGLETFSDNYIFIAYVIFSTLTLPSLLSKTIFKSKLFGYLSALLFTYFPIQFGLQVLISSLTGLSLSEILPFGVIFNLILWNILFGIFIIGDNDEGNESEEKLKDIFNAMIPAILYILFVFIFIRQKDSVIALDYLQHLTVPGKIFEQGTLCLLPGQCSNLFLQHGYTTIYHIILGYMGKFLGLNPLKVFYLLDIIYPLVASIPIYMILKKTTRSTIWSQLGVLLALLTFVMGGYDFIFLIPQTLALFFFILMLNEENINMKKLIPISILLISTHFIIGTVFSLYLWFKHLFIVQLNKRKEQTLFLLFILLSTMFFLLANIAGFSFEKLFQQDAIFAIGSLTNQNYPHNLFVYIQDIGAGILILILVLFEQIFSKKKNIETISLLAFISLGAIFFFLAPTYANKFVIGLGLFASLIIVPFLQRITFRPVTKIILIPILILLWGTNFYIQHQRYQTFYTQSDGTISAIVEEDMALVEYFKEENITEPFIISDPYTQLILTSATNIDTANAQYMDLETRQNLLAYLEDPKSETYETLILSPGIPGGRDLLILHTSRLERSLKLNDKAWTYNIYSIQLENSYKIEEESEDLLKHQESLGKKAIYISDHFTLFK
jgi:hypothetical protein